MLIYSVSVNIGNEFADEWLAWMKAVHIPEVMATGCFSAYRICSLLHPAQEDDSQTFNIQYSCPSTDILEHYFEKYAPDLQKSHSQKYEGKFVAMRSVLRDET